MGYKNALIRQEFPDLFDGAFVEIRNPATLSWGEARRIRDDAPVEASEDEKTRHFVGAFVKAWNLPPVDDPDADPLPVPPSAADMDRIPAIVYAWIVDRASVSPNGQAPSGNRSERRSRGKAQSKTRITSNGS